MELYTINDTHFTLFLTANSKNMATFTSTILKVRGMQWCGWLRPCTRRLWVQFLLVSFEFSIHIILLDALWPGVDSASSRNRYQEYFLGGKGSWYVGLTLPPLCADCHEIWEPQPPGNLRACPGLPRDCFSSLLIPKLIQHSTISHSVSNAE